MKRLEWSALLTLLGVIFLFSTAILVTLIAPNLIDPSWHEPSSAYQVQMYEISDPNVYISTSNPGSYGLQYVYHLKEGFSLHSFRESSLVRILAPPELEQYVTRLGAAESILTSRLLLLRSAEGADSLQKELQRSWKDSAPPHFEILELYDPQKKEAFAITETDGVVENWIDRNFTILGQAPPYSTKEGTVFVNNPKEYRISGVHHLYNERGAPLKGLDELKEGKLRFLSRAALIRMGEDLYRIEGCWYCHTDQTRTLIQDTVLNGSAEYPAPPSSANEYIYQRVTFPGTRRIGPDLSRVGIKRASRDWHMSHFLSPTSKSKGSIMPSFAHFFDNDPAGTFASPYSVPNYKFEAIYQYLMTKGTRITPPTQAWWLGLDPIQTLEIIEGKK